VLREEGSWAAAPQNGDTCLLVTGERKGLSEQEVVISDEILMVREVYVCLKGTSCSY
jgi:hypothetical protein